MPAFTAHLLEASTIPAGSGKRKNGGHSRPPRMLGAHGRRARRAAAGATPTGEGRMNGARRALGIAVLALVVLGECAHGTPLRPVQAAPDQLRWVADPRGYTQ